MKCPCCATGFKADDHAPKVVCMNGHKFQVHLNRDDQSLTMELLEDPRQNAGVKIGEIFHIHQSIAA